MIASSSARRALLLGLSCAAFMAVACARSDEELRTAVVARLAEDASTADLAIGVQVSQGTVVLAGLTESLEQQERALELTRSVTGVTDVVNELALGARGLAQAVERAIAADAVLEGVPIEVEVVDGLVRLSSDQTNPRQRRRAVELAAAVPGVDRVEDHMK